MKKYIETGKVISIKGLNGEVKVLPWCNTLPDFCKFKTFFLYDYFGSLTGINVIKSKVYKNLVVLKLENINTAQKAKSLVGKILYVNRESVHLKKDEYLLADLIGLKVVNNKDENLIYGTIKNIITNSTRTNIYEVLSLDGKHHYLIPEVKEIIIKIEPENGVIRINPIDGLLDNAY